MSNIIVYTTDTCQRCALVKQMLDVHSVDYTEVTDKDYALSRGLEEVPAIETDGKIISEYTSVLSWLEKNGYYSFEVNSND